MRKAVNVRARAFVVMICGLMFAVTVSAQTNRFDPASLSEPGRQAYDGLMKVKVFAIGAVGYAGGTSDGERYLDVLIEEKQAPYAFKQLISDGTLEAGLYGLFGLKMLNYAHFDEEFSRYRLSRFSPENEESFVMQSGCLKSEAQTAADKNEMLDIYLKNVFVKQAGFKECGRQFNGRAGRDRQKCEDEVLKQK